MRASSTHGTRDMSTTIVLLHAGSRCQSGCSRLAVVVVVVVVDIDKRGEGGGGVCCQVIPLAGLLAGRKASCWRGDAVRIAGMSNENESMDLGLDGLSESSGPNRRAWQRCATRHPQARRNKCPPTASQPASPAATADDSAELAEDKSQEIKHAESGLTVFTQKGCMGGLFDRKAPPSWRTDSSGFNGPHR